LRLHQAFPFMKYVAELSRFPVQKVKLRLPEVKLQQPDE